MCLTLLYNQARTMLGHTVTLEPNMDAHFPRKVAVPGQQVPDVGPMGLRADVGIQQDGAAPILIDVVVTSVKGPQGGANAPRALAAIKESEKTKYNHYNKNYAGLTLENFKPFAVETSGAMGEPAHDVVRYLSARAKGVVSKDGYALAVRKLRERLGVALWRGNARMIRDWQEAAFPQVAAAAEARHQAQLLQVAAAGGEGPEE